MLFKFLLVVSDTIKAWFGGFPSLHTLQFKNENTQIYWKYYIYIHKIVHVLSISIIISISFSCSTKGLPGRHGELCWADSLGIIVHGGIRGDVHLPIWLQLSGPHWGWFDVPLHRRGSQRSALYVHQPHPWPPVWSFSTQPRSVTQHTVRRVLWQCYGDIQYTTYRSKVWGLYLKEVSFYCKNSNIITI